MLIFSHWSHENNHNATVIPDSSLCSVYCNVPSVATEALKTLQLWNVIKAQTATDITFWNKTNIMFYVLSSKFESLLGLILIRLVKAV